MAIIFSSLWIGLFISIHILQAIAQNYQIKSFGVNGSGCAPGTAFATLSSDRKNLSLSYKSFQANAGPSVSISENRKSCSITLGVTVPAGYQFAFNQFTFNGAYSVDSKVQANHKTIYYFQSSLSQSEGSGTITGSASDSYAQITDSFDSTNWSTCGKDAVVSITTSLEVDNNDNAKGSGSFSASDAVGTSFIWRQC